MRVLVSDSDDERLGYFAWALENLPGLGPISELLGSSTRAIEQNSIYSWIASVVVPETSGYVPYSRDNFPWTDESFRRGDHQVRTIQVIPYLALVDRQSSLDDPERYFGADSFEVVDRRLESAAYRAMLAAFMSAFWGDTPSANWALAVLLLRGPLNRQTTIARFLRVLTGGALGSEGQGIPTRSQVLTWVRELSRVEFEIEPTLSQLIEAYGDATKRW